MSLFDRYLALLPAFILSWKLYAVLACCLVLEGLFAVRRRPLLSVELAQDYVFGAFKLWIFAPILLAYTALYATLFETYLPFTTWRVAESWDPALQFVVGFLAADLMLYVTHFLKHKVRVMWCFHAVHHSQRNLNPLTTHRTHVVEDLFEDPIQFIPLALLGVGYPAWIGVRMFNWFWAHLIHSNVRTNLGPLGYVLVSPQYHRVHHSIDSRHQDKNFGERLVVWDWLFGTLHRDFNEYPETGVADAEFPLERSARGVSLLRQLVEQYLYPFRAIARLNQRAALPDAHGS